MHCDQANELLVEHIGGELSAKIQLEMDEHLAQCADCQTEHEQISKFAHFADSWQEEAAPTWQAPSMPGRDWLAGFRQWFPTFASATALAMVGLIYIQTPQTNGTLPSSSQVAGTYQELPALPQATQAAMVERVMAGSREQRQEELQALLKILKAEMDRRSIETEDSLRYVISHQIQGQQELDELYSQVETMVNSSTKPASSTGVPQ